MYFIAKIDWIYGLDLFLLTVSIALSLDAYFEYDFLLRDVLAKIWALIYHFYFLIMVFVVLSIS